MIDLDNRMVTFAKGVKVIIRAGTFGTGTPRDSHDDVTIRQEIHYRVHPLAEDRPHGATPHICYYGALLEIVPLRRNRMLLVYGKGDPSYETTGRIWRDK